MILFALASIAFIAGQPQPTASGASPVTRYRAAIQCPGGEIPFGLEIDESSPPRAWILNGRERMEVPGVAIRPDGLTLDFEYYDSQIDAAIERAGKSAKPGLQGKWTKRIDDKNAAQLPFTAVADVRDRFPPPARSKNIGARAESI